MFMTFGNYGSFFFIIDLIKNSMGEPMYDIGSYMPVG